MEKSFSAVAERRTGILHAAGELLRRDLLVAVREPAMWLLPFAFYVLTAVLLSLGVGARPDLLRALAPGAIWLAALLAALLAQEGMFRGDHDDGSLDLQLLSPHPLAALVVARMLAHWLVSGLPAVVASPVLAAMFGLDGRAAWVLAATLALGTPLVSMLGALGGALSVGAAGRGSVLLALLALPLCVPPLIFSAGAVRAAAGGLPVAGHLLLLGALLVLAATLVPYACAAGLRATGGGG